MLHRLLQFANCMVARLYKDVAVLTFNMNLVEIRVSVRLLIPMTSAQSFASIAENVFVMVHGIHSRYMCFELKANVVHAMRKQSEKAGSGVIMHASCHRG